MVHTMNSGTSRTTPNTPSFWFIAARSGSEACPLTECVVFVRPPVTGGPAGEGALPASRD